MAWELLDRNIIALLSKWAKTSVNSKAVTKDSSDDKKVEEQMKQYESTNSEEEWTMFASKVPKEKRIGPQEWCETNGTSSHVQNLYARIPFYISQAKK